MQTPAHQTERPRFRAGEDFGVYGCGEKVVSWYVTPKSFDQLAQQIEDTITNDLEPVRQKLLMALNYTNAEEHSL